MPLEKPDFVIFDMDGTTVRHLNPWILDVIEKLDDLSYKIHKFFSRLMPKAGLKHPVRRKKYSPKMLVHRTLHSFRRKPVEQIVEPCPNVMDVLNFLDENDIPMGLVSNGLGRGYGHDILEKFKLTSFFKHTLFAEDLNRSKPDPAPIIQMLNLLSPDINENHVVWYIGDRHKDVNAALNAGKTETSKIEPIAYGYFGSACLAALEHNLGTDHIIGSYSELLEKLKTLFGNGKS